ncbi:MAG: hypothetical protein K6E75_05545, partial [Lachnospiraceae bacterium]|nr:hypothetical protein [Lachnospiraceae bacterium]
TFREKKFFIRVPAADADAAEKVFDGSQRIDAGFADEVGLLTQAMDEVTFEEKAKQVPTMITRIRVEN